MDLELTVAGVAVVFMVTGAIRRHFERGSFLEQIEQLRLDVARREAHLDARERASAKTLKGLLDRLDVPADDGGKCRTIDRSRKHVAELLTQRKRTERQAAENAAWTNGFKPAMESDADTAPLETSQ